MHHGLPCVQLTASWKAPAVAPIIAIKVSQQFRRDLHVANQHTFLDCDGAYQVVMRATCSACRAGPNLMFS